MPEDDRKRADGVPTARLMLLEWTIVVVSR